MSIYLEILGKNKIIFSNVPNSYHSIFKESKNSKRIIKGKKIRSLSKKDKDGITLWMVAEDDWLDYLITKVLGWVELTVIYLWLGLTSSIHIEL